MKVAFHFEIELGPQEYDVELTLIRALLEIPPHRRHLRVYRGLIAPTGLPRGEAFGRLVVNVVGEAFLSSFSLDQYADMLLRNRLYVFVVDGLTRQQAARVDTYLTDDEAYAGVLGLDDSVAQHWALYELPAVYRLAADEFRIQHSFDALEGDPAFWFGAVDEWKKRRLFRSVVLENLGAQQTIFDEYDTREHAQRRGETANLLEDQLSGVGNELIVRLWDLDPRLVEVTHAALLTFDDAKSAEQHAHVALSFRRLLERLANALYPPVTEVREGRKLGPAEYRNRLWAYVQDHTSGSQRKATLSSLDDVGARIDRLDSLANAGLHDELESMEVQRLLIALVALIYDLLLLAPPPGDVPFGPYGAGANRVIKDLLGPSDEP